MSNFRRIILWVGLAIFLIAACAYWWTGLAWQNPPQKDSLHVVSGNLVGIDYTDSQFGRSSAPDDHPKSFITLRNNEVENTYTLFFLKALGDYNGCGPRLRRGSQALNKLPQGTEIKLLVEDDIIWQVTTDNSVLMAHEDLSEYSKIRGKETFFFGFFYFFSFIGCSVYYWSKGEL